MLGNAWILIQEYGISVITGTIGTLGFCLLFNMRKSKLLYGCIGGMLSSIIYCICKEAGLSIFLQNMIPAMTATFYAELVARLIKAPATVFLIPSVVPLTPGGSLYYTMSAIVDGKEAEAKLIGEQTILIALGIALGIVMVSVLFYQISHRNVQQKVSYHTKKQVLEGRK